MQYLTNKLNTLYPYLLYSMYLVGLIGLGSSTFRDLFLFLTPLHLLGTALLFFSRFLLQKKAIVLWLIAALVGFCVECIGVKTGLLFGPYSYTDVLGLGFLEVPLVIGILWASLSFSIWVCVQSVVKNKILVSLTTGLVLMCLDYFIEPVAIAYNFWSWETASIPFKNYCMWFLLGAILGGMYSYAFPYKPQKSSYAWHYVICQLLFFVGSTFLASF